MPPPTTLLCSALVCLVAAGCGQAVWCEPGPWRTELWSGSPRVEAELRDGCGFPDSQIDYRITAHGRIVLEGSLEHFERRHAVRHLEHGAVEIAIWDRACAVTMTAVDCHDLDYHRW